MTLCEQLVDDVAKQRQVSRRLKTFVEEAASEEPDRSFLEITGKGLIEAAKTIAAMVNPMTQAVKGVLDLISGAI